MKRKRLLSASIVVFAAWTAACAVRPAVAGEGPAGQEDLTSRILYGLVQSLDGYGRREGRLPDDLESLERGIGERARDAWGRPLRYRSSGLRYELRSSGGDDVFETSDDIVATGQAGRNRPCEIVIASRVVTWAEFAPRCAADRPVAVLPLCPSLLRAALTTGTGVTAGDSVSAAGMQLVGIARRVDGASREVGGVVPTLRPVPGSDRVGAQWGFRDIWGTELLFVAEDAAFTLRSAGRDLRFDTEDDIVVAARPGREVLCRYNVGSTHRTCDVPPPPC